MTKGEKILLCMALLINGNVESQAKNHGWAIVSYIGVAAVALWGIFE